MLENVMNGECIPLNFLAGSASLMSWTEPVTIISTINHMYFTQAVETVCL